MDIYIGNLSYNVEEAELKKAFEEFGEVSSVKIITHKHTGRSKGFAFVEMQDESEAQSAIEKLNGYELDGRKIVVSPARPKKENES